MRRILFLTCYFPPVQAPSGDRVCDFATYFSEHDWEVDVVAFDLPENAYFEKSSGRTPGSAIDVIRIHQPILGRVGGQSPRLQMDLRTGFFRYSQGIRGVLCALRRVVYHSAVEPFLFPDAAVVSVPRALPILKGLFQTKRYDVLFSVGPPLTVHLLALLAKRNRSDTFWIAHWSDPLTFGPLSDGFSRLKGKINKRIEDKLLKDANLVTVSNYPTKAGFLHTYPMVSESKIQVISHYFDAEEYVCYEPQILTKFTLVYTGLVSEQYRDPKPLLEAVGMLRDEFPLDLIVIGKWNPEEKCLAYLREKRLQGSVHYLGSKSREGIVSYQKGGSVLVLWGWKGGFQIPKKLYEYIGARRPILCIEGDNADPAARIVAELKRGISVENSVGDIVKGLRHLYRLFKEGRLEEAFDLREREEFMRSYWLRRVRAMVEENIMV